MDISKDAMRLATLRNQTTVLKSLLTENTPFEMGRIPTLTSPLFDHDSRFLDNIIRLIAEARSGGAQIVSKAPSGVQFSIQGSKIDQIHTGKGDDRLDIVARGDPASKGLDAVDNGSVTNVSSGAGNDMITIDAEELVYDVRTGQGDDMVSITAAFVAEVRGNSGKDEIHVSGNCVDSVDGGSGDDTIDITASLDPRLDDLLNTSIGAGIASNIKGGAGNDRVHIKADFAIGSVDSGSGADTVSIESGNFADHIHTGSGSDSLSVNAKYLFDIDGGSGNDRMDITGHAIHEVNGGTGNDTISITALSEPASGVPGAGTAMTMGVSGGDGNDRISVNGGAIFDVSGGNGNDKIVLEGETINFVSGGKGADTIVLNQKSTRPIIYGMAVGDGHDTITTNSDLEIHRYSEDGLRDVGLDGATLKRLHDGSYRLTFADSSDSITLKSSRPGGAVPRLEGNRIVWS